MEVVPEKVTDTWDKEVREDFDKFLRALTHILMKNVYPTKDDTYHNLKRIINDKTLVVVTGDKNSCMIIIKRADYIVKMQTMIDDSISCGLCAPTKDNTLKDNTLKIFCDFLYCIFKYHPKYEKMLPTSNQPAWLYGKAKSHKFALPDKILITKLKFRPIIAQTGSYTYNAAQVIAEYLKHLVDENLYVICNMQYLHLF